MIPPHSLLQIIHEVRLDSIDDLDRQTFRGCHRLRESLHDTVIGDGDRRMPPAVGLLHQLCRRGYRVHLAHFGMHVEFYTLLRRIVMTFRLKRPFHSANRLRL